MVRARSPRQRPLTCQSNCQFVGGNPAAAAGISIIAIWTLTFWCGRRHH